MSFINCIPSLYNIVARFFQLIMLTHELSI